MTRDILTSKSKRYRFWSDTQNRNVFIITKMKFCTIFDYLNDNYLLRHVKLIHKQCVRLVS